MSDVASIDGLYQELILDHNRAPRNRRALEPCTHHARRRNPVCGDVVEIFLHAPQERVVEASFLGESCAICTASASLLTELVPRLGVEQARELAEAFHTRIHRPTAEDAAAPMDLGDLSVLLEVRHFPGRERCATLPWETLLAALEPPSGAQD